MRKYVFPILGISFLIIGLLGSLMDEHFTKNGRDLKITIGDTNDISNFDPADLSWASDYNLLRGLYSPLVELNNSNQLVSAVADEFYWDKNDLVFHIRNDLITQDGHKINASDAYYSFKRLMVLDRNLHGDLYAILDCKNIIQSINDKCDGMSYDDTKRELRLTPKNVSPMLLFLFTSIDFVVIPKNSFSKENLKIIDYRNTTGPYFYRGKDIEGNIVLSENKAHWHISKNSPTSITLVTDRLKGSEPATFKMFLEGELDAVPTASLWGKKTYNKAINSKPDIKIHKTDFISVISFKWTKKGMLRNPEERRGVGVAIQELFHARLKKFNKNTKDSEVEYRVAPQFFPKNAHGSLSDSSLKKGHSLHFHSLDSLANIELTIWFRASLGDSFKKTFDDFPLPIKFVSSESEKESADIAYGLQDLSYEEDISLISFCLSTGRFNSENNRAWLKKFTGEKDAAIRVQLLKDLHYRSLFENPSVVPIMYTRYYAISQNGWKMNFAKHWARSPYWQYFKED